MSMVTSCPACATTFRVLPEQLTARQGKVRCGKCDEVFDAYKTLASYPDEPLPPPPESAPAPQAALSGSQPPRSAEAVPVQATLDIDGPSLDAIATASARRDPHSARYLGIAVALLSIALLLQLLYVMRTPLAAAMPGLRPHLEALCAIAGCTVPLPKRTEALAIESSDLQFDPKRPGVIVLLAALRNRGAIAVELPALELTLTNAQDQPIARRIFLPQEYLERPAEASAGMRAAAEINVRIELAAAELKAAGYRLFLFYP